MTLYVENQLFPPLYVFKKLINVTHVKLEKCERFEKRSFRNRYVLAGANGVSTLTIPVKGGREQKALITDIEIDNAEDWQTRHWRGITSGYRKSPFFDYYAEGVRNLLFSSETKLFDLNTAILQRLCDWLNLHVTIGFTDCYQPTVEGVDLRNKLLPKNFQSEGENWQPRYSQVFEDRLGFQANLSILDLLFCEGPNAANLLQKSVAKETGEPGSRNC